MSPLLSPKFQTRVVMVATPWGSELASVKVQAVFAVHAPEVNPATGSSLVPVSPPLSPPQAQAPARMKVVAASSRIDRIESSQPRVTVGPTSIGGVGCA